MSDQTKVKIVIPIYHIKLTSNEMISLLQCKKILNKYPICIIKPANMVLQIEEIQGMEIKEFDEVWFQSIQSYSLLMLAEQFYQQFCDCEYILIYQLDAFVFRDELQAFCSLGYDYIGAPWLYGSFAYMDGMGKYYYVGNGGLSLRKVKSCLEVLKEFQMKDIVNEDIFWASREEKNFRIAPIDIALQFAFETNVKVCFEKNQRKLPFGCHAWQKYDFSFYRPLFQDMGYDISDVEDGKLDQDRDDSKCDFSKVSKEGFKEAVQSLLPSMTNEVWIWGAGQIGKKWAWLLLEHNICIKGFVDSDTSIYRTKLYGKEVCAPSRYFEDASETPIVIAILHMPEEIRDYLCRNGKQQGKDYISWEMLQKALYERFAD